MPFNTFINPSYILINEEPGYCNELMKSQDIVMFG